MVIFFLSASIFENRKLIGNDRGHQKSMLSYIINIMKRNDKKSNMDYKKKVWVTFYMR